MDRRILVSGASGTLGSAICDALLAGGDEVVGLSRSPDRARATNPTVTWHAWRPASERPPEAAFEGVDAVVNMVGASLDQRLTDEAKERIRASRVRATKNLVDGLLAAARKPTVLVSQCAVGYYGDRGDALVDESSPPGDDFLARLCVDWEQAALAAGAGGVRVASLRSAPVLDPASGLLKQLLLPFRLGVGGPLAGGSQYMPWIHRGDLVGLVLWALAEPEVSGPVNASVPEPITNREFSRALGRVLGRPAIVPVPKLAIAALRGSELADAVTSSQRVIPRRALDLGFRFRFAAIEPALRDLLDR
ncbi:MAG TPA: TIGR01777 family oxidoreductase [Solirubrobacterales bacterium]|nr:TIGR01777 family oxidoreductase [Solirubrobacterales bacterium]